MSLGRKKTYTGIVRKETWAKGSKSEHEAIVLDTGSGPHLKLRVQGLNPFRDPALDALVGKCVQVEGIEGSGVPHLFVEKLSDITALGKGRTPRPGIRPPRP